MAWRTMLCAVMAALLAGPGAARALAPPETVGLSSNDLAKVLETVRRRAIPLDSLYIERDGQPVLDLYVYPFGPGLRHDVASVSKSISAMTVGAIYADRPDFGMDQPILADRSMSLGDALSMRGGRACGDRPGEPELFEMMARPDWAAYVAALPARGRPGGDFAYCSPNYLLASAFVSRDAGLSLAAQADRLLFRPLGIEDWRWPADPQGRTRAWGDLDLRAGDLVKIGRLVLDGGAWQGRQVVPAAWMARAVTAQSVAPNGDGYGYGFWLNRAIPGLVEARGRGGQGIAAWPSARLLVVTTASDTDGGQTLPLLAGLRPAPAALPADPRGAARLARAVAALSSPPPTRAPGHGGARARALMGVDLALADPSWVRRLTLQQTGAEGSVRIDGPFFAFEAPLGFDGRPRLGAQGPEGGAVAGLARWVGPEHLTFEIRAYGIAQRVVFDVFFKADGVRVRAREASGLFAFETTAVPATP
ncbi:serine hydrolase domain-containing protein [Phenylobacterium aquaticum]|uniref:serine hydrolase domain-containing protein n=1 Tax=Phenylobacterium aquaticum TaxID=1763816 RepID=UPI001F5D11F7|nr:serine hydrolase domain-containing protein [Phenylobacterium aquaticum]MCI3135595.1 beta-lactamase family protein [Phenylobacterium aquaticum]